MPVDTLVMQKDSVIAEHSDCGQVSHLHTALRNNMQIVFEEMSSWTPLTMYIGMKTTF